MHLSISNLNKQGEGNKTKESIKYSYVFGLLNYEINTFFLNI